MPAWAASKDSRGSMQSFLGLYVISIFTLSLFVFTVRLHIFILQIHIFTLKIKISLYARELCILPKERLPGGQGNVASWHIMRLFPPWRDSMPPFSCLSTLFLGAWIGSRLVGRSVTPARLVFFRSFSRLICSSRKGATRAMPPRAL